MINIKLSNIISPNDFIVSIKAGETPYPIDSDFIQYGDIYSGGTSELIITDVFTEETQYWVKLTDIVTNRYIIENITTNNLYITITPTPTTTQTSTPTPTPTITPSPTRGEYNWLYLGVGNYDLDIAMSEENWDFRVDYYGTVVVGMRFYEGLTSNVFNGQNKYYKIWVRTGGDPETFDYYALVDTNGYVLEYAQY